MKRRIAFLRIKQKRISYLWMGLRGGDEKSSPANLGESKVRRPYKEVSWAVEKLYLKKKSTWGRIGITYRDPNWKAQILKDGCPRNECEVSSGYRKVYDQRWPEGWYEHGRIVIRYLISVAWICSPWMSVLWSSQSGARWSRQLL